MIACGFIQDGLVGRLPKFFLLFLVVLVSLLGACSKKKAMSDVENGTGVDSIPTPGSPSEPVPPSSGIGLPFLYGSNMGAYSGWTDQELAELLMGNPVQNVVGAGVNSLRPAMYDSFVQHWGYDIRVDAFKTYQQLGGKDHTIFLNGPSEAHRDQTRYCDGMQSQTFANLYEPIWLSDGKVNPDNYYANYVYNVVKTYRPYVKYWEVWNEPDYTNRWQATQTWTHSDPDPCDLTNFAAPVQSYVRMLRITYEIVKQLDNEGMVCVGGLGYPSFLDAILRNTDNPNGGEVSAEYSKRGGEWFDCVSYHVYPMYDLGDNRNSDAAATAIINHKNDFQAVLDDYSYNGTAHPAKVFIVTEVNIPRKAVDQYVGGDEVQRNFLIKAAVVAQKAGISGLYIYGPTEGAPLAQVTDPYQAMGLYQYLTGGPYQATITPGGIAWRTVSHLLKNRRYDPVQTAAMKLPPTADGGAFYHAGDKSYVYVLWAKTTGTSEAAAVTYHFPASFISDTTTQRSWENKEASFSGGSFSLTGSPVFIMP